MKKLVFALILAIGGLGVASCTFNGTSTEGESVFTSVEDVNSFQAISASELLFSSTKSTTNTPLARYGGTSTSNEDSTTGEDVPVISEEIYTIDDYLGMINRYLGSDGAISVTKEVSDDANYQNKTVFVTKDIEGNSIEYILYFNEELFVNVDDSVSDSAIVSTSEEDSVIASTSNEDSTSPLTRKHDHEHFADSENITYLLTGKMIYGDVTYNVEGKKFVEDDKEILMVYSFIDEDNFVQVRYQEDENVSKFFYKVVTEGTITSSSKVQVVNEDGKTMVKLTFEGTDGTFAKYQFLTEVVDNVTTIKIKYDFLNANGERETGVIVVYETYDSETDTITYTYEVITTGGKGNHGYKVIIDHEGCGDIGKDNHGSHGNN